MKAASLNTYCFFLIRKKTNSNFIRLEICREMNTHIQLLFKDQSIHFSYQHQANHLQNRGTHLDVSFPRGEIFQMKLCI